MLYARINELNEVIAYPVSHRDISVRFNYIKKDFGDRIEKINPATSVLEIYVKVQPFPAPDNDQKAYDEGDPLLEAGVWKQSWVERDFTQSEIDARNDRLRDYLDLYRDDRALHFDYKGIVMKLGDGARADLLAMFLVVSQDLSIPNESVMANWQETGYDSIQITAGDLRADAMSFFGHRQKCFTARDLVLADIETYINEKEVEDAFNEAYST